jgi:tetratricopeptide (TPR) repeat protein
LPDSGKTPIFSKRVLWILLALIAVNVIIYAPVRHYDFVEVDDPLTIRDNPHVAGGLAWPNVVWAFTKGYAGYWMPLTFLSHMVDVQLYGLNAGSHHVTNLLLHIANTILLFGLLYRMTAALGRSAFVAGLFAAHPLHVESVAWVTERKDVLSTMFWLLALWAYVGYTRQPRWDRYLRVLLFFALGLMAKPMLVTLPFALLLLDVWPLRRVALWTDEPGRPGSTARRQLWSAGLRLVREKIPLFALAAVSSVIAFVAQRQAGAVTGLDITPITLRVENALLSYVAYIGKMLWPARLAVLYPFPQSLPAWQVIGAVLILAGVSFAVMKAARRYPYLSVGWFWYLGTLVPVIGLVRIGLQAMADRFTYVPLIGLFVIVSWGALDLLSHWPALRRALPVAAGFMILACTMGARGQVRYWENNVTLWTRATKVLLGMDNYHAHIDLGTILRDQGRLSEAISHFSEAVRLKPDSADAHYNLGMALARQGRTDEAIASFSQAVRIKPDSADTNYDLGLSLARQGRIDEAIASFSEAARLKPDFAAAHLNLGLALAGQGKNREATASFSEAVRLKPDSAEARHNLGLALASQGRIDEAIASFSEVVRLKPDFAEAHSDLGLALSRQGKVSEAFAEYSEALRLKPDLVTVHINMGALLANQGKINEAISSFSEAVRLKPDLAEAHQYLGLALASQGKNSEAIAALTEAVRLKPGLELAHVNLGVALAETGKLNEAIHEFTEVLRLNPNNDDARRAVDALTKRGK